MPRLSVWMVRAALVHLIVGFALGAVMLTAKAAAVPASPAAWIRPLHIELLLLGWTANLGFGVAYWILPRPAGAGAARAGTPAIIAAFVLLNAGVVAAGLGAPFGLGRMAEAAGAAAFAAHAWPRVRPASPRPV